MNIILSGHGKMGRMIENILSERNEHEIYTTEDIRTFDLNIADSAVCIDFTTPDAFRENYRFLADNFQAVVVGTTGWNDISEEVISYFKEQDTTMIYATNFSIGVNVLFRITELCSKLLSNFNYKSTVTEIHHIHKLDKPSGTASTLASIMAENLCAPEGVDSIREAEVPGIHIINYENPVDKITISHEAFSREGFARGAVEAALMTERINGVYEFRDLIK